MGKKFWIILCANIVISVLVPVLVFPALQLELSVFESVIIAILVAIILFVFEVYVFVMRIQISNQKERRLTLIDSESDKKLYNVMVLVQVLRTCVQKT